METSMTRGRPKDLKVAARDEAVRKMVLEQGPISRNEIMDRLDLTGSLTYLSLTRLRSKGLVDTCLDERKHLVWCPPDGVESRRVG